MTHLSLALLGSPEIRLDQQLIALPTRKALALCIYILLERRPHSREHLMALFWPESDLKRAQTSLRTTLAYIRKSIANVPIIIDYDTITYQSEAQVEIDVLTLQAMATSINRLPLNQSSLVPALKSVGALIRGDFLTGFSLSDSLEFDDWLLTRREGFHQQAVHIFATLSQLQLEFGLIEDGLQTTNHWIRFDALDERAYQRHMQLHLANGNRIAALQTYKTCCLMLANEYGIQASAKTNELAKQAQLAANTSHKMLDSEAECIALNRMATTIAQSSYDIESALDLLRQALFFAKQLNNPLHLAETTLNLSQCYFYTGELEHAFHYGDSAMVLSRQIGRQDLLGRALNSMAYVSLLKGDVLGNILHFADEAVVIFNTLRQPSLVADALTVKANAYLCNGYPQDGFQFAQEALTISTEIQNDWGYASAAYNLGLAYVDLGDIPAAIEICEKGLAKARVAGHPPLIFFNMLILGHIYRAQRRLKISLEHHQQALSIANRLNSPFFKLLAVGELCADYTQQQLWDEALKFALEAQNLRMRIPYPDFTRWFEIKALIKSGAMPLALEEMTKLQEQLQQTPMNRRYQVFLRRVSALLAAAHKQFAEATAYFQEAMHLSHEYEFLTELAEMRQIIISNDTDLY